MLAAGMLITWAGYSISLWGWCLIRGYDVTLGQLMSPTHPYGSGKGQPWPPKPIGDDVIFPGGRAARHPPIVQSTLGTQGIAQSANPFGTGKSG